MNGIQGNLQGDDDLHEYSQIATRDGHNSAAPDDKHRQYKRPKEGMKRKTEGMKSKRTRDMLTLNVKP